LAQDFGGTFIGDIAKTRADALAEVAPSDNFIVIDLLQRDTKIVRVNASTIVATGKTTVHIARLGAPVERTFRFRRVWEAIGYKVKCTRSEVSEFSEKPAPAFKPPLMLMRLQNICGFGMPDARDLNQCASYEVYVNGDDEVRYSGDWGVRTLGRRSHKAPIGTAAALLAEANRLGIFDAPNQFRGIPGRLEDGRETVTMISHANAATLVVIGGGRGKRIYDFYGTPQTVRAFEATLYDVTGARRYTGRPLR
jgi:hypothetical protein